MKNYTAKFGNYLLERRIAVGGMAEVFKATFSPAPNIEKDVALKIILPHLNEEDEYRDLFVEEAKISVKFNHPNIVQVYDFGEISERYFFAMEYIDGLNAKSLIRKSYRDQNVIPIEIACEIIRQILHALDYAHGFRLDDQNHGVIHRDVSPQNILVSKDGVAKLTDFGIAKASIRVSRTKTGVVRGKIKYMSPEQAHGEKVDARTDQYALGIVFYELLVGMHTGDGEMMGTDLAPVTAYRKEVPASVEEVIKKMTDPKRENRYRNCKDIIKELDGILEPFPANSLQKRLGQWVQGVEKKYPTSEEVPLGEQSKKWQTLNQSYAQRLIRPGLITIFFLVVSIGAFSKFKEWVRQDAAVSEIEASSMEIPEEKAPAPKTSKANSQTNQKTVSTAAPTIIAMASKPLVCPSGMVKIEGGTFLFGSDPKHPDRNQYTEASLHEESYSSYCIDRYEYPNQEDQFPITAVPWEQAQQMCTSEGKRLCTEIEWERACKGGRENKIFSYGNEYIQNACNVENKEPNSVRSGSSKACVSQERVFDLTGNVEEWVSSSGRFRKDFRVTKGGASHLSSWASRCASNQESPSDKKSPWIGFRCCKS
ncbi:MAG: bifunctional serine/threonine-protein kinase/formylglycine-generating enzyme family protein [Bdellovibrionota bacterium]